MVSSTMAQLIGGPMDGEWVDLDKLIEAMPDVDLEDFDRIDLLDLSTQTFVTYYVAVWRGRLCLVCHHGEPPEHGDPLE